MQLKITSFLLKTQNTILSATFIMATAGGLNAIFGFVKSRWLITHFGISRDLTVFYMADKIPNIIYSVLIVGAVSTLFIPIFTSLIKKNREEAFKAASSIINATMLFFVVFATGLFILAPLVMQMLSLGKFSPAEIDLGTNLIRLMLISQLLLVIGSLLTSLLQSYKFFLIPALAPVFYNVGMLAGIAGLSPHIGIYGPAVGTLLGAILHVGLQLPLLKKLDFTYIPTFSFKDKGFKDISKLVPPRVLSVLAGSVIEMTNNSLALLTSSQAVIYLKNAVQLQNLPVTLFGLSIATALLPALSEEGSDNNYANFKKTFLTSFFQMLFLILPLSVILIILRIPVVRLVYGVETLPWEGTIEIAYTLAFYSLSIFAQSANYLLTRAFYALKDTLTPVWVGGVTLAINIPLSYLFIKTFNLGAWSLGISYSIMAILDTFAYMWLLNKKVGGFKFRSVIIPFLKISYSAVLMGITLYIPIKLLDQVLFDTTRTWQLATLTGIAGICGLSTYLFFTKILNVEEINIFYALLRKLNFKQAKAPLSEHQNVA